MIKDEKERKFKKINKFKNRDVTLEKTRENNLKEFIPFIFSMSLSHQTITLLFFSLYLKVYTPL